MENKKSILSSKRLYRIRTQGYCNISDEKVSELAFGNRFAFYTCSFFLAIGVVTSSIPILTLMMTISIFGIVLPYHPFDYVYNYILSGPMNKPKLPRRARQLKFACVVATVWLASIIYLIYAGLIMASYISGGLLFSIAFLVSTTDLCIPSLVYNFLFKYEVK